MTTRSGRSYGIVEEKKTKEKKKEKKEKKKKEKKEKYNECSVCDEDCFICGEPICGEPNVEHDECPPDGHCPTCDKHICSSCWWSYSNSTDACIFCLPDSRPEECECPETKSCKCLKNAKKGIRGHFPTWKEIHDLERGFF